MLGCTVFVGIKDRRLRDHVVLLHTSKELLRQGCVWQGQSLKGRPQRPWDEAVTGKPELQLELQDVGDVRVVRYPPRKADYREQNQLKRG